MTRAAVYKSIVTFFFVACLSAVLLLYEVHCKIDRKDNSSNSSRCARLSEGAERDTRTHTVHDVRGKFHQ